MKVPVRSQPDARLSAFQSGLRGLLQGWRWLPGLRRRATAWAPSAPGGRSASPRALGTAAYVGITVARHSLEVALSGQTPGWTLNNDAAGHALLRRTLLPMAPRLVLLEASAGQAQALLHALESAGLRVLLIHPIQARDFARCVAQAGRHQRIDAPTLRRIAVLLD